VGAAVARLVIPRIDLDEIVLEGVDNEQLNAGPGHLPGSVLPGARGNAIVSAHRDRHFSHFDALTVGDTLLTDSPVGRTKWVIVSQRVVDKDARALFARSDTTLTLTTCWPIRFVGAAPSRLIITAKPVGRVTRLASVDLGRLTGGAFQRRCRQTSAQAVLLECSDANPLDRSRAPRGSARIGPR
jgi:sortase A